MSGSATGPFVDDFSRQSGSVWTITLDAASTQLTQLAQALGKADLAAELAPPTANGDTDHPAPKPLTEEGKRATFETISSALDGNSLKEVREQDLAAFCNLYTSVAYTLYASEEGFAAPLRRIVDAIVSVGSQAGFARYQALVTLYNSLPTPVPSTLALYVLAAILRLAATEPTASTLEVVRPILKTLPARLAGLSASRQEANAAISNACTVAEREPTLAHSLLKSYLAETNDDGSAEDLRSAYLALSLRLPRMFDFPLGASTAPEAELAQLILAGKTAEIESLKSVPDRVGDKRALVTKARCVAVARALAPHSGRIVSYDEVQKALGLQTASSDDADTELEGAIIDAIKSGLISARLSQPRRQISISRAQAPDASDESKVSSAQAEWSGIQARLTGWKSTLDRMLNTVCSAAGQSTDADSAGPSDLATRAAQEVEAM